MLNNESNEAGVMMFKGSLAVIWMDAQSDGMVVDVLS